MLMAEKKNLRDEYEDITKQMADYKKLRQEARNLLKMAKKQYVSFTELVKILQEENRKSKKREIHYNLKEQEFRKIAQKKIKEIEQMEYTENGEQFHIDAFYGKNNQEKSLEILTICYNFLGKEFLAYSYILEEFMKRTGLSETYANKFMKNLATGINQYNELTTGIESEETKITYIWFIIEKFIEKIIYISMQP